MGCFSLFSHRPSFHSFYASSSLARKHTCWGLRALSSGAKCFQHKTSVNQIKPNKIYKGANAGCHTPKHTPLFHPRPRTHNGPDGHGGKKKGKRNLNGKRIEVSNFMFYCNSCLTLPQIPHSILRLPSYPLSSPPFATVCHGGAGLQRVLWVLRGYVDSDSYSIFHAAPRIAASKGKTPPKAKAKSLKPKIFCHCRRRRDFGRGMGIVERGLDASAGCRPFLHPRPTSHCPSTRAYVINGVWVGVLLLPLPLLDPLQGQGCKSEMEMVKGSALLLRGITTWFIEGTADNRAGIIE